MYYAKSLHSYHAICEVLDEAVEPSLRPLAWRKPLYTAIDEMYETDAPDDMITVAERISIALLKLDWAILRGQTEKAAAARKQLAELSEAWCGLDEAEALDLDALDLDALDLDEFALSEEAPAEPESLDKLGPVHVRIGPNASKPLFAGPSPVPETIDELTHGLHSLRNHPGTFLADEVAEDDLRTAFDRQDVDSMTVALERITRGGPLHA